FRANDKEPFSRDTMLCLDVLVGNRAGSSDAPLSGDDLTGIARQPRGLSEGAARAALHDPDMDVGGAHEAERFLHQAPIDPDHRHYYAEQKAQPDAGQKEAAEVVPYVLEREVHFTALV